VAYKKPIEVGSTVTDPAGGVVIEAIACHANLTPSSVVAQTYQLDVALPVFSPASSTFTQPTVVTLSDATAGATLCYTANGTPPQCSSGACTVGTAYQASKGILVSADETLTVLACHAGMQSSPTEFQTYALLAGIPQFEPTSETTTQPVDVTLSTASAGATLCYTTDGAVPACTGGVCQAPASTYVPGHPVVLDVTSTVVAITCGAGLLNSEISAQVYTIER
jgi:hypothetical protein